MFINIFKKKQKDKDLMINSLRIIINKYMTSLEAKVL